MSDLRLNAIIALEKGAKAHGTTTLTNMYHLIQKASLFNGLTRTYRPKNEDGDTLPDETTKVQLHGDEILREVAAAVGRMFDVTITKDTGNRFAVANIKVGDEVIATDVPVSMLLFLEKQLGELQTFLKRLPTLDPAETWTWDNSVGTHRSVGSATIRTKKVPRNHVKAEATDRHPAQVEVYTEDVPVGTWTAVKFSGAFAQTRVNEMLARISALLDAVKIAREEANSLPVADVKIGESIFKYLGFVN